jgi:hypothetical protein
MTLNNCLRLVALAAALAGCIAPVYEPPPQRPVARPAPPPAQPAPEPGVALPAPEPEPAPEPQVPEPIPSPAPPASSGATAALLQQSRQQSAAGNYPLATSSLERALRINPRDAELWLELGRVKLRQDDRAQAESMGRRALSLAGSDPVRRAQCEELIAAARGGR